MPFITLSNLKRFLANLLSKNLVFKKSLIIAPNMYDEPGGVTRIGSFMPMPSSPTIQIPQLTIQSYDRDKGNLGGVFYRGDEVATKRYADGAVEKEAKRWKDAYNNLRKRSYPTTFDREELTLLTNTSSDSSGITLSKPYTNFDGLLLEITDENNAVITTLYVSTEEIERSKTEASTLANQFFLVNTYLFYVCSTQGLSSTFFPRVVANCVVMRVYGVKFKEIT